MITPKSRRSWCWLIPHRHLIFWWSRVRIHSWLGHNHISTLLYHLINWRCFEFRRNFLLHLLVWIVLIRRDRSKLRFLRPLHHLNIEKIHVLQILRSLGAKHMLSFIQGFSEIISFRNLRRRTIFSSDAFWEPTILTEPFVSELIIFWLLVFQPSELLSMLFDLVVDCVQFETVLNCNVWKLIRYRSQRCLIR